MISASLVSYIHKYIQFKTDLRSFVLAPAHSEWNAIASCTVTYKTNENYKLQMQKG